MNYIKNINLEVNLLRKHLFKHLLVIFIFTIIYQKFAKIYGTKEDKENFENFENTLYFTTVTHFTIGYGDISPKSKMLKRLVILHIIVAFLLATSVF